MNIRDKITTLAQEIYGADDVSFEDVAAAQIDQFENAGFGNLPICMAKTHLSLSHDPKLKGAPSGFTFPIREVRASAGAGFIYPLAGNMRTMPGLGKSPAAHQIDIDEDGNVVGLSKLSMTQKSKHFPNRAEYHLLLAADADERSPGAAVTVALCGHWEHDGTCRWPHYSSITQTEKGPHRLAVEFDAPDDELEEVTERIEAALAAGQLKGPDGRVSVWRYLGEEPPV